MNFVKKNISTYTEEIKFSMFMDLRFIFDRYNSVRNVIFNRYSSVKSLLKIYNHEKEIRDILTAEGFLDTFEIPKRYVRMAIDDCIGNIKGIWVDRKKYVRSLIWNNKNLGDEERHYLYSSLKNNKKLYNIMNCVDHKVDVIFASLDTKHLNILLRRYMRKAIKSKPHSNIGNSVLIDAEMYSVVDGKFFLSGLKKSKRYKLDLVAQTKLNGNLRLVLNRGSRKLTISNAINVKTKKNDYTNIIGIDKNYVNAIDTSTKRSYGTKLNLLQNKYTDELDKQNKKRQYYYDLIKKLEKIGTEKAKRKIDNIRKFNLGKIKYNKKKNRLFEEIKKNVNSGIKKLIVEEKAKEIVAENLNFTSNNKKYGKKAKNKLNRFVKGYIQERLDYKTKINEMEITKVNAAYTSQTCPDCENFGERKKDMFYCQCGKVEYSGYVAAEVVLQRKYDKEITLSTSPKKVKQILTKWLSEKNKTKHLSNSLPSQPRPSPDLSDKERIIQKNL